MQQCITTFGIQNPPNLNNQEDCYFISKEKGHRSRYCTIFFVCMSAIAVPGECEGVAPMGSVSGRGQ
jgi:hypothetical protein